MLPKCILLLVTLGASLVHFIESHFDKNPFMTTTMPGLLFSFVLKMPTG